MKLILKTLMFVSAVMLAGAGAAAADLPRVEVWKDPNCGCCSKWVAHLREAGFEVTANNTARVGSARARLGMPERYAACHSAKVKGYVIEGHVPAADIKRLLEEKPDAIGLAVPGMPMGSPGMEGPYSDPYQTLLIKHSGGAEVYAEH